MDARERTYPQHLTAINDHTMTAVLDLAALDWEDDDPIAAHLDSDLTITVRFEYAVCPLCGGTGRHVNPAIDSQGLTSEDFAADPDFAADYMGGVYDVDCARCGGARVIPQIVTKDRTPAEQAAADWICEAEDRRARAQAEREYQIRMGY